MRIILLFFSFLAFPWIGYGQVTMFRADSIPLVDGKVVFHVDFISDLDKKELQKEASFYLNDILNPYSGVFHASNEDHIVCRITDYINISSSLLQSFGMFMSYSLSLQYKEGGCTMVIWDLTYVEKKYHEAQEASQRRLNIPEYAGEDIMIDGKYTLMFVRKASERITEASVDRINEVIKGLEASVSNNKEGVSSSE